MRQLTVGVMLAFLAATAAAQAPSVATPPRVAPAPKPAGTLAQLMRSIYFPNSNLMVYRDKGPADSPARCTPPAKR